MTAFDLRSGQLFAGKYCLEGQLGEGGVGVVWAATEVATGTEVALKFLKSSAEDDSGLRQRFVREARAAAAIQHPNVVHVHEVLFGEDQPPVIVMERCRGRTLAQSLTDEQRIAPKILAEWMLQVVSALSAAHSLGIVHRDLKPENIFLTEEAGGKVSVKVLDFGLAKLTALEGAAAQSAGITQTGAMLGTPYYMSPEQVYGERDVDHRTDVWALGIVLYECLSGERPTEAANVGQIFKRITRHDIVSLERSAPSLPVSLTRLADRMLAGDKSDRPELGEVTSILQAFLRNQESGVRERAEAEDSSGARRARPAVAVTLASIAALTGLGVAGWRYLAPSAATSEVSRAAPSVQAGLSAPAPVAAEGAPKAAPPLVGAGTLPDAGPKAAQPDVAQATSRAKRRADARPEAGAARPRNAKKSGVDLFSDPL